MSNHSDQDFNMEEIDEDELLAGLSAEELKQLQHEIDVFAPDENVPVGVRQQNVSHESGSQEEENEDQVDVDEDSILAGLSAEELKQLQHEMEVIAPDERVPVGMRQKDQTAKPPTGSFDHRSLVDYLYWEKQSKRLLEEERIPTILLPSQKKMEDEMSNAVEEGSENAEVVESMQKGILEENVVEDCEKKIEKVIEEVMEEVGNAEDDLGKLNRLPIKTETDETNSATSATSQAVFQIPSERSDSSTETEISRLKQNDGQSTADEEKQANQPVPASSVYENWVPEKEKRVISKLKIPKLALGDGLVKTARPSGNDTNLESTLKKIRKQNSSITEVNLNNIENIPKEMLLDYIEALKKNKHVKTFSIANTGADENIAFSLANMLRENRSITTLNIDSNFITGKGIIAIMRCLQFNETLTELRFHNQRHMLGHHAENEVARLLKSNNTLLKMGYHFELPGPRMVVTNLLTRNLDLQRQQRKEEQRIQNLKAQRQIMDMYADSLNLPYGLMEMLGGHIPELELVKAAQGPQEIPERAPQPKVSRQLCKTPCLPKHQPPASLTDSANMLKDVKLKKTPKCRDPLLELNQKEERSNIKANIQLRSTPKQRGTVNKDSLDDRSSLKDVIKGLKPVPRRRQPPKVELTPRDQLLNDIRQSNVAYLKAVPLPKCLESSETSLF